MAAQQVGTVSETKGEVFARNADGQMRRLSKGDPVFERDVIITAAGSAAQIAPTNGPVLNVAEQQTVSVDGTVVSGAPADPSSGGVSPLAAAEAARVIQDPNALLEEEAAAAGLTGGDGNAGHGFVDLVRIVEGVGGANYGFPVYDRGGPQIAGGGQDIENGLPTAGNLDISLDEDDIRSWSLDSRPDIGAWIGEFQTAVGNPWSAYYDFGNNDVVDSSDEIPVDSPTTMVGNLNFSYGPDGGGNIVFNTPTEALTSSGEEIHYWVSADGHSLVGYIYEGYDGQQPARVNYDGGGEDNYEEMSDVKVIFSAEITNVATGEFSFTIFGPLDHPIGGTEDNLVIPLKFTVSDATGDAAIGTLTVNIDDDSPVLAGYGEDSKPESLTDSVDEANIGTAWSTGTDANDGPAVTSGDLSGLVDFGADGEGSFGFSSNFMQTLYSTDFWWGIPVPVQLKYSIVNDGDTTTLVATEPDMPLDLRNSTNKVFELELNTTNGEYEFRLYDELRHTGDSDESLTLNFGAIIEAKDYDGDPVSLDGAFQINVEDDVPNAQIRLRGEDFVQHDETPGVQNAYPDKDVSSVGLKFLGISNTGDDANVPGSGAIGYARSGNPVVTTAGSEAGADHLASDSLSLVVLNTASGLQTTEGYDITLSMDNAGRIIGRVNDTDAGAMNGKAAFAIALDQDGEVFVAQYLSLNHPNAASADEVINLSGKVAVRYTMTDTDGDTRSADVDVGTSVRFADDGPTLTQQTISQNILEANIDTAWSTGSNMSSASPNNVPTVVTGSLAGLVNFGADGANGQGSFSFTADATSQLNSLHLASYDGGARPLSYAITYDGNVAVLTATETDGPGYGNSSNPVFVLRLDQATGQYTFTLSDELMHTGQGQGDVIGLNFGSMIQAKDGDNDPVLLGRSFTINVQDDVPAPENDFRTINEDTYGWISGNVLDNDESGADHQTSFNWLNTKGKYGDFDGFSNGGYTYNLDNANAQQLDDGEKWVEQFKYTIKDSDGDERPAVLTITIEGRNDQPTIKVDTGNWFNWNDEVEESDMATGSTPSGSGEFAYGTFKVADPDGLDDIKTVSINGTLLPIGGMVGKHIDGDAGTLTITGYNDKTGEASYKYELTEATIDGKGTETDVFKLTVSDGDLTDTATITIDIIDDRPTARSDTGSVNEGATLTVAALNGVLANDTVGADVPGVVIGVRAGSSTSSPATNGLDAEIAGKYGTLNLHADGSYTYKSTANAITGPATDTFVYTMRDNDGDQSTTTLKISLTDSGLRAVNDDQAKVYETALDLSKDGKDLAAGTSTGLNPTSTGETDDSQTLADNVSGGFGAKTFSLVGSAQGTYGTIEIHSDGTYTYTLTKPFDTSPDINNGTQTESNKDSFTYKVTDANGNSAQAMIYVDIVDDVPVAHADPVDLRYGELVTGNVLDNDESGADSAMSMVSVTFGGVTKSFTGNTTSVTFDTPNGLLTVEKDGDYSYQSQLAPMVDASASTLAGWQANVGLYGFTDGSWISGGNLVTGQLDTDAAAQVALKIANNQNKAGVGVVNPPPGGGNASLGDGEHLVVDLKQGVTEATVGIGQFNAHQGDLDSAGWTAYNAAGVQVGSGSFDSAVANGNIYEISISTAQEFQYLVFDWAENNDGYVLSKLQFGGEESSPETFNYVMQDGDGDQSGATLTFTHTASGLEVGAWSDSKHNGEFDPQNDNQTETFTVTSTPVENEADAAQWIGKSLKEGTALSANAVAASAPRDITLAVTSDITFTFLSEGAGYQNAVGWYDVGNPGVGHIVWSNSSAKGSDGDLISGKSTVTIDDVPAGTQLGFFLIPDAYSPDPGAKNVPLNVGDNVYFKDGHAYTDATYTTAVNSTDNGMPGDADPVWFSNNPNPDGLQHAITGLGGPGSPDNLLYVGFEDLGNGGDKDYNDVVFTVDLGEGNSVKFDPVVFDLGVDINTKSELSLATIDFQLGDGDTIQWDAKFADAHGLTVTKDAADDTLYIIKALDGSEPALSFDGLLDTFQLTVGHTGAGEDYTKVDDADRSAEVKVVDTYGNFDVTTAVFDLNIVLPETQNGGGGNGQP